MNAHLRKTRLVYDTLRGELLSGKWKIGEKLPKENEVAKRFGCSTGTANKALTMLAHEGFLERKARAGTTIVKTVAERVSGEATPQILTFVCIGRVPPGLWRTAIGFQNAGMEGQYRTVVVSLEERLLTEDDFVKRCMELRMQGSAIYIAEHNPHTPSNVHRVFQELNIPWVIVGSTEWGLGAIAVGPDDFHAGNTLTNDLISRGANRIGFFGGDDLEFFTRKRYRGYKWALEKGGLDEPSEMVRLNQSGMPRLDETQGRWERMAIEYLEKTRDIDAVVCGNERLGVALVKAAREMGMNVPRDLLVGVLDDLAVPATKNHPDFVTYQFPFEQVGMEAYRALDSLIKRQVSNLPGSLVRGAVLLEEGRGP